ncbi:hypothetical protein ANANG_G00298690 [Anguilla anguilla]|uniref:Uncharacterized protein n=1 Tax=Anguilla anguilla TaxID=7936 RepID=A0A9D3LK64_ANGAN|nr:hypothetical protein ANANG_G00298690 [Anguilla anguilla]
MWVCNLCRKQQDIMTKSGEWLPGRGVTGRGGTGPGLGAAVSDPAMCTGADRDKKARSRSQAPPARPRPATQDGPQTTPPRAPPQEDGHPTVTVPQ